MAWVILGKKIIRKTTITMAETNNQEVKSKRDLLRERMLKRNPELNVEDPEAMSGDISDYLDELDGQLNGYKEHEAKLTNMMNTDPRSAYLLASLDNGEDLILSLVKLLGTNIRDILDDPDSEASKEYARRAADGMKHDAETEANIEETKKIIAAWQEENGLSDEEGNAVLDFLQGVLEDGMDGKVSQESLNMGLKAIRHDEDVAEAADAAEIRGKNARVKEELRKRKETDGISALDGTPNTPKPKRQKSILELAREEEMGV